MTIPKAKTKVPQTKIRKSNPKRLSWLEYERNRRNFRCKTWHCRDWDAMEALCLPYSRSKDLCDIDWGLGEGPSAWSSTVVPCSFVSGCIAGRRIELVHKLRDPWWSGRRRSRGRLSIFSQSGRVLDLEKGNLPRSAVGPLSSHSRSRWQRNDQI